jgi:hypothetical protein
LKLKQKVLAVLTALGLLTGGVATGVAVAGGHTSSLYIVNVSDTSFNANTTSDQLQPQCDAGDKATGGGYGIPDSAVAAGTAIWKTEPLWGSGDDPIGWDFRAHNASGTNGVIHVYVICNDIA